MPHHRSADHGNRWFRPSPKFERFAATRGALIVGALFAVGAAAATGLAIWRQHWLDAAVYAVLAVAFAVWVVIQLRRRHQRPRTGSGGAQVPR